MLADDICFIPPRDEIERVVIRVVVGTSRETPQPAEPSPTRADTVEGGVRRDAIEPATHIRLVIINERTVVELQERILRHFLRLLVRPNDPNDDTKHSRIMSGEQRFEGTLVTVPNALQQYPIRNLVRGGECPRLHL